MQAATATLIERQLKEVRAQLDGGMPHPLEMIEQANQIALAATEHDLICTHDLEGRILSVNPAACGTLGLSAATLRKMTIQELLLPAVGLRFRRIHRKAEARWVRRRHHESSHT